MADLVRSISLPLTTDYMSITKYRPDSEESPAVRVLKDLDMSIAGEHVLLTMEYILAHLENRGPASLRVCTLFNKPSNRVVDLPLHYVGFDLPDRYVVGYGLDHHQKYRNLPYLAVLKREADAETQASPQSLSKPSSETKVDGGVSRSLGAPVAHSPRGAKSGERSPPGRPQSLSPSRAALAARSNKVSQRLG